MDLMIKNNKEKLRKLLLGQLLSLTSEETIRRSKNVEKNISDLPIYKNAKTIMAYYPLKGEVSVLGIIKKALGEKKICFPVIDSESNNLIPYCIRDLERDFTRGPYGVMQPDTGSTERIDLKEIDLVLTPGIAYDRNKNRLGRGAGFYDRFIAELGSNTKKIGVAFDFQILDDLPVNVPHDRQVDMIVTETDCF